MDVVVSLEQRFYYHSDGSVWTKDQFPYSFWERYLDVFDRVLVFARAKEVSETKDLINVTGDHVDFQSVPYYHGFNQFIERKSEVKNKILEVYDRNDFSVVMRVNSLLSIYITDVLKKNKHPYALEVVGDPWDSFSYKSFKHPLCFIFKYYFTHKLKQQCKDACAVSYVTESILQKRYPTSLNTYTTNYSSIDMDESYYRHIPRMFSIENYKEYIYKILFIGSLSQYYKGLDILLFAIKILVEKDYKIILNVVGDGSKKDYFEGIAKKLNLLSNVIFKGMLKCGDEIVDQIDRSDIFILPSCTEGLPRAMIEAMARGLPCIGTNIGGIPELLSENFLVPIRNPNALACKIEEVITNPELMNYMSIQNLSKSKQYSNELLKIRRNKFYKYLENETLIWLSKKEHCR